MNPGEDLLQESRLRGSEKDLREHHFVLDGIREAIAPLVLWCEAPSSPEILSLPKILHLSSPVRAWLRDEVGIMELIMRLHPTAAVAGAPREAAMDLIREVEGRARGWYAGAVGWIGPEDADLAVAIRSAVIRDRRLTVHGGAGIVRGSLPDAEWEETARKAASFTSLFAERIT
jgi:isochorismate synthase EntC